MRWCLGQLRLVLREALLDIPSFLNSLCFLLSRKLLFIIIRSRVDKPSVFNHIQCMYSPVSVCHILSLSLSPVYTHTHTNTHFLSLLSFSFIFSRLASLMRFGSKISKIFLSKPSSRDTKDFTVYSEVRIFFGVVFAWSKYLSVGPSFGAHALGSPPLT